MTSKIIISGIALLTLWGCTDSGTSPEPETVAASQTSPVDVMEIQWEDLMPEGEDALLAELYSEYYENLENRMIGNATPLGDLGDGEISEENTSTQDFDIANIAEGSANDTMEQIGTYNVVESLNGVAVRIPGYVVPLDFSADAKYSEFLLVPYFGACLHSPPPPPNQIVYVKAEIPAEVDNIYDPVWLEGTLKTGEFNSELGNTAYELKLSKIEPYVY